MPVFNENAFDALGDVVNETYDPIVMTVLPAHVEGSCDGPLSSVADILCGFPTVIVHDRELGVAPDDSVALGGVSVSAYNCDFDCSAVDPDDVFGSMVGSLDGEVTVVDPFAGGGRVIRECASRGIPWVAIDVDASACDRLLELT